MALSKSTSDDEMAKNISQDEKIAKNLRGRAKSALTRTVNFINNENQIFDKHDILNKLQRLESIYSDFDKADANLPLEMSEMEEFEEKYYETKAKLQNILEKLSVNVNMHSKMNEQIPIASIAAINSNFKLPRINIQSFNGNYKDWTSFKDLFVSLVHNNESLTNIQKFQYLRGLLLDEPASIIKHIPISDASYLEAWEKLLSRYDRKKKIISALISTFMNQSSISYANASNLRTIADTSDEVIRGLKSIDSKATSRDVWLIYILLQKVDSKTREEWSQHIAQNDFPTFEQFLEFINNKCSSLEMYHENVHNEKKEKQFNVCKYNSNYSIKCILCKMNHFLFKCPKYKDLSVEERNQFVRKQKLCINCLSEFHHKSQCNSNYTCHICKNKHHSSLHKINNVQSYAISSVNREMRGASERSTSEEKNIQNEISTSLNSCHTSFALLPTACVYVTDCMGQRHKIRIMCDTGSESTFLSESCINLLGIKRKNARFPVRGLSNTKIAVTKGFIELDLISIHDSEFSISVKAFILDKLTNSIPNERISKENLLHLKNIQLADPDFQIPNKVDMILGSDYFFSILLNGKITCSENGLMAQNSIFGFLVSGKIPDSCVKDYSIRNLHIYEINIDNDLKRFWELEEVYDSKNTILSPEEQFVETHFAENYSINSEGRFVVKLPFVQSTKNLSNSKPAAISRLFAMEKKFEKNPEFEKQYKEFMREYETLNHMELIHTNSHNNTTTEQYFLPHHAVFKDSSTTTKLRVVFDASFKTTNGTSLNSVLGVGPKLQRDIFEILLNFRFPEIVFSADVEKMYRQILVSDDDQNYQQIVWRYNTNEDIQTYKLKTVTYGLAPASFLATRCIKQIALNYSQNPISRILLEDIYMDDLLSGSNSVNNAITICKEISQILRAHGFHLRKWNSNSTAFLSKFQEHLSADAHFEITPNSKGSVKVLGLFWNSSTDTFIFKAHLALIPPLTKRNILAESARIFDPLGLIAPCTVVIKIFYQKLWLSKGDWDSPIPQHLAENWFEFQRSFNEIGSFTIPRHVILSTDGIFQLHGFSDSSTLAYSAAIYCRQTYQGETKVSLLTSKTKVAPIKQISIPKLELCGAYLLSKLFRTVMNVLKNYTFNIFAWTDSNVVLSWLSAHPRKWKTFVANRTSEILEMLPAKHWIHVPSKENPADIASRGIDPKRLPECNLWWSGPEWLLLDPSHWPKNGSISDEVCKQVEREQRSDPIFCNHSRTSNDIFDDLFKRYSSLSKIIRILAYCQRFSKHCKPTTKIQMTSNDSFTPLSFAEIKYAEETIIRSVQSTYYHEDLQSIKQQKLLPNKSQLSSLYPFVDENGLLRVGGRLQNSQLTYNRKHPIILPSQHKISELLIKERHIAYLHAGPILLSHIIKQSYWIIGGKRLINKHINKCLKCHRFKLSHETSQLMGNLPVHRVTLERPFFTCGIDYAGPITIKFNKGRGNKTTKGYIVMFICFATKAVHIEAVSDLTADSFIATLRRFCARRGTPRHIYSDNATNFVGARRKLDEMQQWVFSLQKNENIAHYLAQSSIEWHFIPPGSPHFGGIWEAAIRSTKYHLKRVIGDTLLTFEELITLLAQIESLLNSRPLTHVNDTDIDSINILTPAHFLTGDVITSVPDESPTGRRNRWEILQNMKKGFWKAWNQQYISTLQQRKKWKHPTSNLKMNDLVLIKEDNTTPGSWPMGKIVNVHPGKDNIVRVATVKTQNSVLKRPVTKLALIPIYQD